MQNEPTTFRDLIDVWGGVTAFRADMGLPYVTAQKMYQRNSINVRHWPTLIERAKAKGIEVDPARLVAMKTELATSEQQ